MLFYLTLPNWVQTYFQTAFQSNLSNDGRLANRRPADVRSPTYPADGINPLSPKRNRSSFLHCTSPMQLLPQTLKQTTPLHRLDFAALPHSAVSHRKYANIRGAIRAIPDAG